MTSLTDRYLAATLRSVPPPRREEIGTELRASIEDMIEDRTGAGLDAHAAEREVLTELGDPEQLAARYADRRLQLIGPRYYLIWQRLLRMLLTIVPGAVGVIVGVVEATVRDNVGGAIGAGVVAAIQTAVQTTFWVTLVFALLERVDARLHLPAWSVDQLPDTPYDRDVTLTDTCVSIAALLLAIGFLFWQHFQTLLSGDAERLPMLNPALWASWLPVLIAVLVASVGLEIAKYRAGRWTWRLVAVNATLDLAFAGTAAWLLLSHRLLNPDLVQRFTWLREGGVDDVARVGVVLIAATTIWDVLASAVKARRHGS